MLKPRISPTGIVREELPIGTTPAVHLRQGYQDSGRSSILTNSGSMFSIPQPSLQADLDAASDYRSQARKTRHYELDRRTSSTGKRSIVPFPNNSSGDINSSATRAPICRKGMRTVLR